MNQNNISTAELFQRVRELLTLPELEPKTRNKMMHDTLILRFHAIGSDVLHGTRSHFARNDAQVLGTMLLLLLLCMQISLILLFLFFLI